MFTGAMFHALNARLHPEGLPYAWVITRDRAHELWLAQYPESDEISAVGTAGPEHSTEAAVHGLGASRGVRWRIYGDGDVDEMALIDDGRDDLKKIAGAVDKGHADYGLVFEGLIFVEPGAEEDWSDAPVNDWALACHGLSDIRYDGE